MNYDDKPVRVAFLGTGYIADWHAKAVQTVPGAKLVAVCDKDLARAHSFAERHGATDCYSSLEAMLRARENDLDAIHVLLPPDLHAAATRLIIQAGIHVLVEKPIAVSPQECMDLIKEAEARGIKIGVNHNYLFAPVYEQLKSDLMAGILGRPDHITMTWNRGLDQLQSGPFDLWMLRDPRNIMLEVGPHCLSALLDLVGDFEVTGVQVGNPVSLPSGCCFYRRWQVQAGRGATGATLSFSFASGFTEQDIHIRGGLGSSIVDFERNTYVLRRHTRSSIDFDRYRMIGDEASQLRSHARHTLARYVLSKLKLSTKGSSYGLSISRAVQAFYTGLSGPMDSRLSAAMGLNVVSLCVKIGQEGANSSVQPPSGVNPAPSPPVVKSNAESSETAAPILVLGATGFIGQELARQLLAAKQRIRVLVRNPGRLPADLQGPGVEIIRGDLSQASDLNRAVEGVRHVFHLARANVKTWEEFTQQDIEVTRQVAEACMAKRVERLIYTGTIDSYYAGIKAGTITEATPLDPHIDWRNLYARAKAASEEILMALHREQGLPVVIFRPGIVLGRGGSPFHWGVGMWSWNAVCQIWGQGRNPLPFVLVEDVARALVAAVDIAEIEGESFNLVAETDLTAFDYLKALEEHAGVSFQKFPTPPWKFYAVDLVKWAVKQIVRHPDQRRPSYRDWESRTQRAHYDCTKARRLLNWIPVSDRDEIIRRGIQLPGSEFLV